jgi:hypothetical protein
MRYIDSLDFYDKPDYALIKNLVVWMKNKDSKDKIKRKDSLTGTTETICQTFIGKKRNRGSDCTLTDHDRTLSE